MTLLVSTVSTTESAGNKPQVNKTERNLTYHAPDDARFEQDEDVSNLTSGREIACTSHRFMNLKTNIDMRYQDPLCGKVKPGHMFG
jgi:hypothetical protein